MMCKGIKGINGFFLKIIIIIITIIIITIT
jgi:hypothetical protein